MRNMAIAEHIEYAKERARWWASKHPYLRDDIMAVALLTLVEAFDRRIPDDPKAFISRCIENAVVDLLEGNYTIKVPRSEIARRQEAKETLETLPRAVRLNDEELWNIRKDTAYPTWMAMQVDDVGKLLELTPRERRILLLRQDGYTNEEIGIEFSISEAAIRKAVALIRGRYLTLLQTHKGILKPE